jgi:hypothetical protein
MVEKVKKIWNPLTVIGLFSGISEVACATLLGIVDANLKPTFIWFVMGFPLLIAIAFFLTLNFNNKALYAPMDYREDKSFLTTMFGNIKVEQRDDQSEEKIQHFKNKTFLDTSVNLCNKTFENCEFKNCQLEYDGSGSVCIVGCSFEDISWLFSGNAGAALKFISSLYSGFDVGGRETVLSLFNKIQSGNI